MTSPELLAHVPLLAALEPPEREALARRLGLREAQAGQLLVSAGEPGDALYLVEAGEVELFLPAEAGRERLTLRRAGPGGHFGEVALLDGGARSASAVALAPTRLRSLSREAFLAALARSPGAAGLVLAHLAAQLRGADALLAGRASRDVVHELDAARTLADRLAERVAALNGSWTFLFLLLAFSGAWAAWNLWLPGPFDPYPFAFFNLVLAVLVVLQGPLLMMSQNREAAAERAAAAADYRVNLKNEIALERLGRDLAALRLDLEARLPPPARPAGGGAPFPTGAGSG